MCQQKEGTRCSWHIYGDYIPQSFLLPDVFAGAEFLNLALQKSGESLALADIPVYLDKTMSFGIQHIRPKNIARKA